MAMSVGKVEGHRYLAQCQKCGAWHEIQAHDKQGETYFAHREGVFSCCGLEQKAIFIIEKDELDFH
jgi:hypothetical protein